DQHLRHDRHSPGHRQRRPAVQVELPSADRPEPARFRARTVRVRLRPAEAYLPSEKIAIAVAITFAPQAFDAHGNWSNSSDPIFRAIGAYLAPNDPPPGATS